MCFNKSVLEVVKKKPVLNVGSMLGGYNATLAYLQLMADVALFIAKEDCMQYGIDQGLHNYLAHWLWHRRPDMFAFEVLQLPNDDSPFYTVGMIEPARIDLTPSGFAFYNQRGVKPPVVHQYDRHKEEAAHIFAVSIED